MIQRLTIMSVVPEDRSRPRLGFYGSAAHVNSGADH
jgi:hypothetical protein